MGRLFKGEVSTAIRMLRRNRGRSLLTMFGIIIGVASVVTIVAIGQGVTDQVADQTERLGSDLITIRPGRILASGDGSLLDDLGQWHGIESGGALSQHDVDVVRALHEVKTAVPVSLVSSGVSVNHGKRHFGLPVVGTEASFLPMLNQKVAFGTFLTDSTASNKVILGAHAANQMFDQNVPLGQTVDILGQEFIVSGILDESQTAPLSIDLDFNDAIFIANDEAQALTSNNARIYEVLARPVDPNKTGNTIDKIRGSLLAAHGGQDDFTVLKQSQTIAVANTILQLITALIGGVAVISLLVGGVGIMNVMLVSVTERMHEIGIRKAVGATNRQILRQFVIEAGVLSVSGAAFGILLAAIIAISLRVFTDLTPVITVPIVIIAALVSIIVGVLFGSIPALKAARKDPISALRNL